MGSYLSSDQTRALRTTNYNILLVGKQNSGKTELLSTLFGNENIQIDDYLNVEQIYYNNNSIFSWRIGDAGIVNQLVSEKYILKNEKNKTILMLIFDSCETTIEINETREELIDFIKRNQLETVKLLIIANKADKEASRLDEAIKEMKVDQFPCKNVFVVRTCALMSHYLYDLIKNQLTKFLFI